MLGYSRFQSKKEVKDWPQKRTCGTRETRKEGTLEQASDEAGLKTPEGVTQTCFQAEPDNARLGIGVMKDIAHLGVFEVESGRRHHTRHRRDAEDKEKQAANASTYLVSLLVSAGSAGCEVGSLS